MWNSKKISTRSENWQILTVSRKKINHKKLCFKINGTKWASILKIHHTIDILLFNFTIVIYNVFYTDSKYTCKNSMVEYCLIKSLHLLYKSNFVPL